MIWGKSKAARGCLVHARRVAQTLRRVLEPEIPAAYTHMARHGGAKGTIRQGPAALPD